MKIVMTLMVRDEADIIGSMIEHHLQQGVDTIIVTDNGSIDGTREILEGFAGDGRIELHHDPAHRKQQASVVTAMARRAASVHRADWVLNADADEFWVARDTSLTLREAFDSIPSTVRAQPIPVIDMTGAPAARGSGVDRLVYRDTRPLSRLNDIGLLAHSSPDMAHVGADDITVVQGNHSVDLDGVASIDASPVEVLHLPWRSWEQYSRKVENAGRAYEVSGLTPSPNHHGMRDYRRLLEDTLLAFYVARHPGEDELATGRRNGTLVEDRRIASSTTGVVPDEPLDPVIVDAIRPLGEALGRADATIRRLGEATSSAEHEVKVVSSHSAHLETQIADLVAEVESAHALVAATRNRRVVRAVDSLSRLRRRT